MQVELSPAIPDVPQPDANGSDAATPTSTTQVQRIVIPARSGACPFCTRKHLLKARGYAREVAEDLSREWEMDNLLENLLLAEDHAVALGDMDLDAAIRVVRHEAEDRVLANLATDAARLYADFKAKYFPTTQQAGTKGDF